MFGKAAVWVKCIEEEMADQIKQWSNRAGYLKGLNYILFRPIKLWLPWWWQTTKDYESCSFLSSIQPWNFMMWEKLMGRHQDCEDDGRETINERWKDNDEVRWIMFMLFGYWRSFMIDCLVLPPHCFNCCLLFYPLSTIDTFIILLLRNHDYFLSCTFASIRMSQHWSAEERRSTCIPLIEERKDREESSFSLLFSLLPYFYISRSESSSASLLFWNQQCCWCCFHLNIGICTYTELFEFWHVEFVESLHWLDFISP